MIAISGVATVSGEPLGFTGGPRELVQWERYALSHGLPPHQNAQGYGAALTMAYYLAYACLTRDAKTRPGFDEWLGQLEDVRDFSMEEIPPTPTAPSGEPSQLSPPPQASPPASFGPPMPATSQPSPTFSRDSRPVACGHDDGWVAGCPECEREQRFAEAAMGGP